MQFYKAMAVLMLITSYSYAQTPVKKSARRAKSIYFYWGWNLDNFSKSDISFKGETFDFELSNVIADDRQSEFDAGLYFNPSTMTIPQYNFRVGYFLTDHYSISIGADHMKYVVRANQKVKISGEIDGTESAYNGIYNNDEIALTEDFLKFEHTDGLNYINVEFRRSDELLASKNISFSFMEGIGAGILYPRTNSTLLGKSRSDEFQLSGYGADVLIGLNVEFWRLFFIQTELKGGYINMPNIRITSDAGDKASQQFFFSQVNVVFGARLNLKKQPKTPVQQIVY